MCNFRVLEQFLESLRDFFQREGVENCRNKTCKLYCSLSKVLEMNSLSSEQLMLQYYKSLADVAVSFCVEDEIVGLNKQAG